MRALFISALISLIYLTEYIPVNILSIFLW